MGTGDTFDADTGIRAAELKVVALDCDGVMFDSTTANRAFYDAILRAVGLPPVRDDQVAEIQMQTADKALAYLIDDADKLRQAEQMRLQMDYLPFVDLLRPDPCLHRLLDALAGRYQTAVATNRTNTMEAVLRRHGLEGRFDLVVTAWDVAHPKPHPDPLHAILARFKAASRQMLYVGDAEVDRQAARAAGVWFAACGNRSLEADAHIDDLAGLARLLNLPLAPR